MPSLEQELQQFPIFQGLKPSQMETIGHGARHIRFEPNEPIFKEGEEAKQFFLIRRGIVAIETFSPASNRIVIQTLGSGDVVGWSWLIAPYRWRFAARAVEETEVTALDGVQIRKACEADPTLGYPLLKKFAEVFVMRLQATRLQLLDLYGGSPKGK